MLKKNTVTKASAKGLRFAIVASRYNARYVDSMVLAASEFLARAKAAKVDVIRVPGAFEIPVVVGRLASHGFGGEKEGEGEDGVTGYHALICLGLIIRGETSHADHIGLSVTQALAEAQLYSGVPVIHEVLVVANEEQAEARCVDPRHNRGAEAASTAIDMARLMKTL